MQTDTKMIALVQTTLDRLKTVPKIVVTLSDSGIDETDCVSISFNVVTGDSGAIANVDSSEVSLNLTEMKMIVEIMTHAETLGYKSEFMDGTMWGSFLLIFKSPKYLPL